MTLVNEIGWGRYMSFEGPYFRGVCKFKLPANPVLGDRLLAVISATEGGAWDAYNGYDRMICTSGLVQWAEAEQYSVSDMLGRVAEKDRMLLREVDSLLEERRMLFRRNEKGRWRFFFDGVGVTDEVDTLQEQHMMFQLHSDGTRGTWDPESSALATKWAAAISSVWERPAAQAIQRDFTVSHLNGFVLPEANKLLMLRSMNPVGEATLAAFLSFAANNPLLASRHLLLAVKNNPELRPWTKEWFVAILQQMTFGPGIVIYPHRYDCIRPVLEQLYGLDLPDFSEQLRSTSILANPVELQKALIHLGYDLGPAGADGVVGRLTKAAIMQFQQLHELQPTGNPTQEVLEELMREID